MFNTVCPACKRKLLERKKIANKIFCSNANCRYHKKPFDQLDNLPILIPFEKENCILDSGLKSKISKENFGCKKRTNKRYQILRNKFLKKIKNLFIGENYFSRKNYEYLKNRLTSNQRVLVLGGGTKGDGSKSFYSRCKDLNIILDVVDIYNSPECTVIADAHYLPYKNNFFDFIIVQAVLEHVAFPNVVVDEIWRVMKLGGIVYSEIPFMQNVHEGPYDFTRFTHSGHRLLFREFNEIKSGSHQGAFSSLLFIFSNTISSFTRIKFLGPLIRLLFSRLIRILDNCVPQKDNIDISCGTYLICNKISKKKIENNKWIVKFYKGNQI